MVLLNCMKGAEVRGKRIPKGLFLVLKGSTAVLEQRTSAGSRPNVLADRNKLIANGTIVEKDGFLVFTKDTEFSSPSAAAAVIDGGSANGLTAWRDKDGRSLKQLDEQS
jgi:Domain of unknown function (DUF4357)